MIVSIDNTRTFEDPSLNELLVKDSEYVPIITKKIIDTAHNYWIRAINVLEQHSPGHASFASSYTTKKPFDWIHYSELEEDILSDSASFDIELFREYLKQQWWKLQLWPNHSVIWTLWAELSTPLSLEDFDFTIIKGDKAHTHPFWPFEETEIDELLQKEWIENIIMTGVATEFCVKQSAWDAAKEYTTYLVNDAIKAVDESVWKKAIEELKAQWIIMISSQEILDELKKIA